MKNLSDVSIIITTIFSSLMIYVWAEDDHRFLGGTCASVCSGQANYSATLLGSIFDSPCDKQTLEYLCDIAYFDAGHSASNSCSVDPTSQCFCGASISSNDCTATPIFDATGANTGFCTYNIFRDVKGSCTQITTPYCSAGTCSGNIDKVVVTKLTATDCYPNSTYVKTYCDVQKKIAKFTADRQCDPNGTNSKCSWWEM